LFADRVAAQAAAAQIAHDHPDWWVKAAILSKADEA
jgi:hypothetical protein